jgi:hypothetical protein
MKNRGFNKMIVFQKIWKTGFVFLFSSSFAFGQSVESTIPDNKNQPDVHINVNRELDNNGNVIRYDSTYSWSWSSDGSQNSQQFYMNDSNNAVFFKFFDNQDFPNEQFNNPFDNNIDSLFSQHFNNSYFENMEKQMQEMMQRQQEMMNEYFGQPPLISTPEEKNDTNKILQKAPAKKTSGNGIDI